MDENKKLINLEGLSVFKTHIDSEIQDKVSDKQDKLVAGSNITIDPDTNVISSTGGGGEVPDNVALIADDEGTYPIGETVLTTTNIVDNLNSTSSTDVLSAKQGKELRDIINRSVGINVVDNLTSESTTDALSAKQGKELKELIDSKPVIDNLTSTSTTDALSANQGRVLNSKIPSVINALNSTSTTAALSANQGRILNNAIKVSGRNNSLDGGFWKINNLVFVQKNMAGRNTTYSVPYVVFTLPEGYRPSSNVVCYSTNGYMLIDPSGNATVYSRTGDANQSFYDTFFFVYPV